VARLPVADCAAGYPLNVQLPGLVQHDPLCVLLEGPGVGELAGLGLDGAGNDLGEHDVTAEVDPGVAVPAAWERSLQIFLGEESALPGEQGRGHLAELVLDPVLDYLSPYLGPCSPGPVAMSVLLVIVHQPVKAPGHVNSFGPGAEEESFTKDLAVGPVLACGRFFIRILRGEIPPRYTGWAQ
jgi:hypothetical protein